MRKLPIPGYPKYEIDESGSVYNIRTGKRLKSSPNLHGYHKVNLYRKAKESDTRYIHRLVSETFLGKCPEGLLVRHLDGNKDNNHVSNLAYGTHADNYEDAVRHGTMPVRGLIGEWQAAKTHCPRGHAYTPENTYLSKRGWRNCRECRRVQ